MKLICLNIWGGHVKDQLLQFISKYKDIEFFCLQEVYHNAKEKISTDENIVSLDIFNEIQSILPNHLGIFRPVVNNIYGIAMFVRNDIDIIGDGEIIIHDNPQYKGAGPTHSRNLQWIECKKQQQTYSIVNAHGLWNGLGKNDSEDRILQSTKIKEFLDTLNCPKILCGDFNLLPNTESVNILGKNMQNLIIEYGINSTRSNLYSKNEKFADYIFVNNNIVVNHFSVLQEVVSDHLPLLLDFDIKFK